MPVQSFNPNNLPKLYQQTAKFNLSLALVFLAVSTDSFPTGHQTAIGFDFDFVFTEMYSNKTLDLIYSFKELLENI